VLNGTQKSTARRGRNNQPRTDNATPESKQSNQEERHGTNEPTHAIPPTKSEIENPNHTLAAIHAKQDQNNPEGQSDTTIARWTKVLGVSTILLFFATTGTGIVLYRTDKNIEHQADIMRGQLEEMRSEQRPWVYASDLIPAGRIVLEQGQYAIPLSHQKYGALASILRNAKNIHDRPSDR
jgi:hypothetical protein